MEKMVMSNSGKSDFLVFDLETQRSAQDVGGWSNIAEMKVSVGVIWDSERQAYCHYYEDEVDAMIDHLLSGKLVVGYNHIGFDYKVLSGYANGEKKRKELLEQLRNQPNLDLLLDIKKIIKKRIKLDAIARPTLNAGKSADGLQALQWYKEYLAGDDEKIKLIANYCQQDVEVTRDVYLYGIEKGEVLYEDKIKGLTSIAVNWSGALKTETKAPEIVQLSF
jgi:DEAD/DEAH box helicase domain-containing protein